MSGIEGAHASAGSYNLRGATQAMMSKTAAADEDNADLIGSDTPGSGIATPQPDLQDKRLPGIASYFGQVRQDPSASADLYLSASSSAASVLLDHQRRGSRQGIAPTQRYSRELPRSSTRSSRSPSSEAPDAPRAESKRFRPTVATQAKSPSFPYPTPPASHTSSAGGSMTGDLSPSGGDAVGAVAAAPRSGAAPLVPTPAAGPSSVPCRRRETLPEPAAIGAPSDHTVSSCDRASSTSNLAPTHSSTASSSGRWYSLDGLKGLTRSVMFKSGPSTPTRTLSTAQSTKSEDKDLSEKGSSDGADSSASQSLRTPAGAQAPTPKGKLTVKIVEARGLRRSRDPYVVSVFQRSELISAGPRPVPGDEGSSTRPAMGGVAIQRQASDTGRPMAIPMRSRQSSSTSITEYNTFRNRTIRPRCSSNPKWDAEAIFDVVNSNMLVDISVYDRASAGEEFLGHVDFLAQKDHQGPLCGWFPLRGHADTTAEKAPTGEIYVEALYQRTDKKNVGPGYFEILKLIGKGTFGQVYQVRKKDTKRIYAMKVLQKKVIVQKKEVAHTVGERNILVRTATSDSPFIVGLKFSFQTPSELYLVTDYMSGGELFWHLQKEGRFDERRAKFYIAELILAIQHLHNNDIVYRDLKPENILLDANGHIALCDFGLSKANLTKNDTTNTFCGTTEYLAPEVLLDESGYTKMVDFWSLGVLVFEMCCGWSPFYAEDTQQMYKNIAFGKVRFPRDTLSQEGRNFVKGLLNRNPKHRLGATDDAEELKRHPFFADIDWDLLTKKLITPPFKPKLKSETDVSYFDPEFTNALDQNGSLNERAAALAHGYATSTPLSPSMQANFQGFTFVDESALDDHMRDRVKFDDEDMDDAHPSAHHHHDEDWDNLDDINGVMTNRMSGIVKTSTDQMVGGGHFDV